MQTETVIFSNKPDARRVWRRLADHGVLSMLCEREVRISVPPRRTNESVRELAIKIHNEQVEKW